MSQFFASGGQRIGVSASASGLPGLISFRLRWLDLLAVQGTLKSLLQHHSSKASILWRPAFFMVQFSFPCRFYLICFSFKFILFLLRLTGYNIIGFMCATLYVYSVYSRVCSPQKLFPHVTVQLIHYYILPGSLPLCLFVTTALFSVAFVFHT